MTTQGYTPDQDDSSNILEGNLSQLSPDMYHFTNVKCICSCDIYMSVYVYLYIFLRDNKTAYLDEACDFLMESICSLVHSPEENLYFPLENHFKIIVIISVLKKKYIISSFPQMSL